MIKYPDYSNGIVNLACSVLKYYGLEQKHPTLPVFDDMLSKNYKNVVVMLFDGLGVDALKHHLSEDSFLRQRRRILYLLLEQIRFLPIWKCSMR